MYFANPPAVKDIRSNVDEYYTIYLSEILEANEANDLLSFISHLILQDSLRGKKYCNITLFEKFPRKLYKFYYKSIKKYFKSYGYKVRDRGWDTNSYGSDQEIIISW